jgi:predicted Zn-dependent protease
MQLRVAALAALMGVLASLRVHACGNAVILDEDAAARLLARAERALDEGHYSRVLALLGGEVEIEQPRLAERRQLVLAVARFRSGDVETATAALVRLLKHRPTDPYVQTRVAEALVTYEPRTDAGRAMLDRTARQLYDALEARDLVADAEGWAALARLRARQGDAAGSQRAATRCQKMARSPDLCPRPLRSGPHAVGRRS